MVTVGATHEGENLVVEQLVNLGRQRGAREREIAALAERVLHHRPELAQLARLAVVELVERDQEPGSFSASRPVSSSTFERKESVRVRRSMVCQSSEPRSSAARSRSRRRCMRGVVLGEQPRQMIVGESPQKPRRRGLGDDQPAARPGGVLDRVVSSTVLPAPALPYRASPAPLNQARRRALRRTARSTPRAQRAAAAASQRRRERIVGGHSCSLSPRFSGL